MGTILESTKELAKRFGVETEEQTIKDQIDAITESIDQNFNGSVDIASAVSEFAKNDNPDARLGTKSITENGTYTALDDELDGYSSVTVNVSGEPNFTSVKSTIVDYGSTYASSIMLCRSENGEYRLPGNEEDPKTFILLDPVIKVTVPAPGTGITFTPDENFDGFYSTNGTKMTFTGDEVTNGDGKAYYFVTSMGGNTMTKTSDDFTFTIE